MKYCTNCGTQLSDEAKFCSVCGTKQEVPKAPVSEPAAPKKTAAPPKQTTQTNLEGQQEEFLAASETAGEVVLSSWENPSPKPNRDNTRQQQQYYQQPAAPPQKKKRSVFSWILIILMILIVLYFLGSILEGCKNMNLPPDPGTPEPEPHSGVFVCGADTLFFNGDGKTVSWHFAADGSNVPDNVKDLGAEGSGTYDFLFSHGKARYDVAERLHIHVDSLLQTTMTLPKPASDTLISFVRDNGAIVRFQKLKTVSGN